MLLMTVAVCLDYTARREERMKAELLDRAKEHLAQFDHNGDGGIEFSEAANVFAQALGSEQSGADAATSFFGEVDLDHDERVTIQELLLQEEIKASVWNNNNDDL